MTQSEYARHRGVQPQAVAKAIAEGRIKNSVTILPDGTKQIDPILADQEWAENTRPEISKEDVELEKMGVPSLTGSRRMKERLAVEKMQIAIQKEKGELIHISDVTNRCSEFSRTVRDAILSIPDRLAPLVAASTDVAECHKMLTDELEQALENLANVPRFAKQ